MNLKESKKYMGGCRVRNEKKEITELYYNFQNKNMKKVNKKCLIKEKS